ncbi:MAG: hypothetical protein ACRD8O_22420, partial [Bryobacteraceae bacterium]
QVNGKLRTRIVVPIDADQKFVEQRALGDDKIQQFLEGKIVTRVVLIPGKLINIVIRSQTA